MTESEEYVLCGVNRKCVFRAQIEYSYEHLGNLRTNTWLSWVGTGVVTDELQRQQTFVFSTFKRRVKTSFKIEAVFGGFFDFYRLENEPNEDEVEIFIDHLLTVIEKEKEISDSKIPVIILPHINEQRFSQK